jgi:tetratricopeptide (TPR) repeat protein
MKGFVLLFLVSFLSSCAIIKPAKTTFKTDRDATITFIGGDSKNITKDEAIILNDEPVLIEASGYTSVFLIPNVDGKKNIEVKMVPIEYSKASGKVQKTYNQDITDLLTEVYRVQNYLASNEIDNAISKATELVEKYPNITYFKFLQASCYVMKGNKRKSQAILKTALKEYPDHPEALQLYKSLDTENSSINRSGASE